MIPGPLAKEQITVGSAPDNDVVVAGPGVAARHARITKQSGGSLAFVSLGAAPSTANGVLLTPFQAVPFDFRAVFVLGQTPLPLAHPVVVALLMSRGTLAAPDAHLVVGRDVARASLVIAHPAVSAHHATVMLDRMMVVDHASTSGTYVSGQRIPANIPKSFDPNGVLAFGPIVVPVSLLLQLSQGQAAPAAEAVPPPPVRAPPSPPQASPPQASALMSAVAPGVLMTGEHRKHRTIIGELSLEQLATKVISIGRTPDNQIVVPHPQVSSKHAHILRAGSELYVEDRGSANGTFVRGQRLLPGQRAPVQNGEKVYIGPMPLLIHITDQRVNVVVEDQASWAGKPLYEIEAWDLFLEVPDRDEKGAAKTLLDHVSFKALPGDMIALMGPSGAGKTTLLLTLNGYLPPTSGQVRINGEDLYLIYDALRGSIGYVPQDDIVHPELTVFEAVKYSARFRLPPDYSEEEIDRRVEDTLRDLGLEAVMNLQIGKPEKKVLSGGQRKRVNIALELVTDPVILFLDEPTSGLAADDTTALINLLSEMTHKTGKTIVMTIHQPSKDEFEKFNLAFIMGYGGVPTYFGPAGESAYRFFGAIIEKGPSYSAMADRSGTKRVDNPRDMFDMLNVRERVVLDALRRTDPSAERGLARLEAAKAWRAEFFQNANPIFQKMFSGRRAVGTEPAAKGTPHRPDVAIVRQFGLLLSRYWRVKIRDRAGAAIMFLQAPVIGLMLAGVFGWQRDAVPFWCLGAMREMASRNPDVSSSTTNILNQMTPTQDHTAAMFFVVVSCVWFGTSNAAREIVTERSIYLRERMVNLSLFNYVLSKYVLLSFICILQCAMLLAIVFFALGFAGGPNAFVLELASLVAVAMNATALGLLVSTLVASAEAAMALTPIALIPQVVLGGLMVPMTTNPMLRPLMYVMPARWGFEGAIAQERAAMANSAPWVIDLHQPSLSSAADFVTGGRFFCATAQIGSDSLAGAWGFVEWNTWWIPIGVLYAMTVLMLSLLLAIQKRRDPV
jgi:ABC-type multidrug transport system ATPase subunit/pSer/pThr/pTyr-binding forkhead associated (FHA) protein/ABC-type multidrug transport system permease subunit